MGSPNRSHPHLAARRGVSLPFIVVLMATFIGMSAFAIDISRMHVIRAQLQTSADAGAMAGAVQLLNPSYAAATPDSARAYALRQPVEDTIASLADSDIVPGHWSISTRTFSPTLSFTDPSTNAVQVTTHHTGSYFFGPIYDVFSSALWARAIGSIGPVRTTSCMAPLALPYAELLSDLYPPPAVPPPVTYNLTAADIATLRTAMNIDTLKTGSSSSIYASGNFYAVDLPVQQLANGTIDPYGKPVSGAKEYQALLGATCGTPAGEFPGIVSIGDWLSAENGKMEGPTKKGIADRCGVSGGGDFNCSPPVDFVVPVWDVWQQMSGGKAFHVKYLAGYKVTGFHNNSIVGYFHTMAGSGTIDTLPSPLIRAFLAR